MSSGNGKLRRLLDRLTPEERLRAAVAAKARDDEDELRALWAACPRKTYTMADARFDELWNDAHAVTLGWALGFYTQVWKWTMPLAARAAAPRKRHAEDDYALPWLAVAATLAAWEHFCAAAGFDPSEMLRAWLGPGAAEVLKIREQFADALDDPGPERELLLRVRGGPLYHAAREEWPGPLAPDPWDAAPRDFPKELTFAGIVAAAAGLDCADKATPAAAEIEQAGEGEGGDGCSSTP